MKRTRFAAGKILAIILSLIVSPSTLQLFAQGGTWASKTSMPTPRYGLGTGVVNGVIYAVGGYGCCVFVGTVEAYDAASDTWTTKASMPTPRHVLSISVVDDILYAIGGMDEGGTLLGIVEAYNPATDTWTTKASMPTPRLALGTSVVNGIIYAVGGGDVNDAGFFATVEAYDPSTDTWTTKASMPTPRLGLSTSVVDGIIYAVGGKNVNGYLGTVEAYDPASNTWATKASMPTARVGAGTGVVNGIIYAVGGGNSNGNFAIVEAYDPTSDSWTTDASMSTVRAYPGIGTVNNVLYVMGGGNFVGTTEAFTPVCSYKIVSTDNAGNFGFTAPLLNPGSGSLPNINSASVNQTIPLQVTVTDCHGNPATDLALAPAGTVELSAANTNICTVDNPDNAISTGSAGNSGWQNMGGGMYHYNWKPQPLKGACLSFSLNLGDGLQHVAYFEFK